MDKEKFSLLSNIKYPEDLRKLSIDELPELCRELREDIIEEVAVNPGHFASSLGVVEITVALHYIYNTPYDRIVWDVGHQAYGHKILTGRRDALLHQPKAARHTPLPHSLRERIRHLCLRARQQLHFGGARHGCGRQAEGGERQARSGSDRRRSHERRTRLRGNQQRIEHAQRPAHHTQRQRYEYRPGRGRYGEIPAQPRHQRYLQPTEVQGLAMAALERLPQR